jgi:hypothetical protein
MDATSNRRLDKSIDKYNAIPLAGLAEVINDQNIESVLMESVVESLDAVRVEALWRETRPRRW